MAVSPFPRSAAVAAPGGARRPPVLRSPDIERALAVMAAGFGVVYIPLTWVNLESTLQRTSAAGSVVLGALVALFLLGGLVTALKAPATRLCWAATFTVYLCAVAVWPLFADGRADPDRPSWLVALLVPATLHLSMAVRTFRGIAAAAGVAVALLVGAVVAAEGATVVVAARTVLLLAPVVLVLSGLVVLIRRSAAATARVQRSRAAGYAARLLEEVTETERARTDGLLHDIVLTTLLQASSAAGPDEEDLARRMALNAVRVLAHVNRASDLGPAVRLSEALKARDELLLPLLGRFDSRSTHARAEDLLLPSGAADALIGAMLESMSNSLRHAGPSRRTVSIDPLGSDGVRVRIADDGVGFDPGKRAGGGIATRIVEPMHAVEGRALIEAGPGEGTTVQLYWGSVSVVDVRSLDSRRRGSAG